MGDKHFAFLAECESCGDLFEKTHLIHGLCRECAYQNGYFVANKKRASWYE